jgi:twitching motility two-component system response regulator PilG
MPRRGRGAQAKRYRDVAFASVLAAAADSGKLYALCKRSGPWQTRLRIRRVALPALPIGTRASMSNDGQGRNSLSGIKVMVIDDSNTIRRSAEIFLLQAGCTVILAEDGFDALAKIADHQPDLVFVDIMMPRLDGYQTCALIKKNSRFHAMPVVMLSSKDGLFDRARGRMVGSDQYLTKPFTKESLLKAVAAHVKAIAA